MTEVEFKMAFNEFRKTEIYADIDQKLNEFNLKRVLSHVFIIRHTVKNMKDRIILEVVKTIRGFVLRHMDNDHIMTVIKEHPDFLLKSQFACCPGFAKKLLEAGLCKNEEFLKMVELY